VRAPVVAGTERGAGATTVARALHGHDGGTSALGADVLVCRAGAVAHLAAAQGSWRPVLAVVGEPAGALAPTPAGPVIVLPHVEALREGSLTLPEVAALLARHPTQLAAPLRAFADALRELADALVRDGRLSVPPAQPPLWCGLVAVERRTPAGRVADVADTDPDDDTVEAQAWRAAG